MGARAATYIDSARRAPKSSSHADPSLPGVRRATYTEATMATLSIHVADLRASLMRELSRLHARHYQGGPRIEVRDGALYAQAAHGPLVEIDSDLIAVLARLPDGAGVDAVAGVLS